MLPPLVGGLHCGAAVTSGLWPRWPVLPPLVGGLHCGKMPESCVPFE